MWRKRAFSRTCRTPKHLIELYQAFLKKMNNNTEANFNSEDNDDFIHLEIVDLYALSEIDHVIGGESVKT